MQLGTRARVDDLPFGIASVPVFESEGTLDAVKEGADFLARFESSIQNKDWETFGQLFSDNCWWKDSLTLTFDKRTLHGRDTIVKAWKALSSTRTPSAFSSAKDDTMDLSSQFIRMAPELASLDVPFGFSTDAPKSKCIGLLKLVPEGNSWKIWVINTDVLSLYEHPFMALPRQSPSVVDASQRGKATAQGLPRVQGVLDAIVIGASTSGLANTIMLDAIAANVVAFDMEPVVGGAWSTKRYDNIRLHHPAFMIQLPMFPVPNEGYPIYLTGRDLTRYYTTAVEALKLPVFCGIEVLSNNFEEMTKLWSVRIRVVKTGDEAVLKTRNLVISTGFIVGPENPMVPDMINQHRFQGPIQHTTEYRTSKPYEGKKVIVVGSGNSAHDVANNLVHGGAKQVTILQRSPTVLLDFETIAPMLTMRYQGNIPVDTADFLETSIPLAIMRDLARGMVAMMVQSQSERNAVFESKGYMLDKTPCLISRAYEERGRAFYVDQPKTFELVLSDQIKIERGEAKGFEDGGLIVYDKGEDKEKVLEAGGVVFATGYRTVDLPKLWAESGFIDAKSAADLVNVSLFGLDTEGEVPGYTTFSGHPHLYFSGMGFYMSRWVARYTAIQVIADVKGQFPERYTRS